ncbi:MAG: GNAT family N-acetyltransferase, partial [Gammaproteobacteria bacterium]
SKGKKGSFANPIWEHFHRTLIQERFKAGEIQMLKISNSDDIAFLFNYIWRGKVYVLQMGFHYTENKRFKPGYVAHAMAIVHNKAKGMAIYDFMHGESRYKKSLSNKSTNLYWVVLQRQRLKFSVEKIAVSVVRRFRKITGNKGI